MPSLLSEVYASMNLEAYDPHAAKKKRRPIRPIKKTTEKHDEHIKKNVNVAGCRICQDKRIKRY